MENKVTLGCLVLFFSISSVLGTSKCYSCGGSSCNDPFNKTASSVAICSDSNSRTFPVDRFKRATTADYVCAKYYYQAYNQNQTQRTCVTRQINGVDACESIRATIGIQAGQVWSCSVCDSDLCNSANYVSLTHLSILFLLQSIALLILVH